MLYSIHTNQKTLNLSQNMQSNYPLVPKQAFLIFPQGKEICFEQKAIVKRLIFGNGRYPEYTQIEKEKVAQFVQMLKKNPATREILDQNELTLLLKMIYAHKYNLQKALENYKDFKNWQKKFIPTQKIDPDYKQKMEDLLKTGVFYCCATRDQYMKPMVVVHVGRILRVKPDQQLFLDTFGYFLQFIIDNMMIDGQLETWNVIVDVDQTSVFSFAGALFDLIKFLSRIFIGRMYRCFIVDYPFLIKFVWGAVAAMMDAEQNEKCRILTKQQMIQLIPKETLQQKYGGELPPLQHFWPLDSPERMAIQKDNEEKMRKYWNESNKLVSQQQYYELYRSDRIGNKKCQQIIQKMEKPVQKVIIVEKPKLIKLTKQEATKLNQKIRKQRPPPSLKMINGNTKESIGFGDQEAKTQSLKGSINGKQIALQKQSVSTNSNFTECFVRKQVFQQMTFGSIFGQ